jgi:hypothetical protein
LVEWRESRVRGSQSILVPGATFSKLAIVRRLIGKQAPPNHTEKSKQAPSNWKHQANSFSKHPLTQDAMPQRNICLTCYGARSQAKSPSLSGNGEGAPAQPGGCTTASVSRRSAPAEPVQRSRPKLRWQAPLWLPVERTMAPPLLLHLHLQGWHELQAATWRVRPSIQDGCQAPSLVVI